jgi:hypothetical protein
MKKLISLALVACVLSVTSIGCGEPAKKGDTKASEKSREGGPADKGTPTK